jgi:hypothetical protein
MSAHDGRIDDHLPVDLADGVRAGLGVGEQPLPGAVGLPATEPLIPRRKLSAGLAGRAFAQVRRGPNIQLLPYALVTTCGPREAPGDRPELRHSVRAATLQISLFASGRIPIGAGAIKSVGVQLFGA